MSKNKTETGEYSDVYGMFDFERLYDAVAKGCSDQDILVEVGCAWGKSAMYLMERLNQYDKYVDFYCIDIFEQFEDIDNIDFGFARGKEYRERMNNLTLYYDFLYNINHSKAKNKIPCVIRGDSTLSARYFKDDSIYFCFLDACHDYEKIKEDINAWYPKVKSGGILAGHDYNSSEMWYSEDNGVAKAVKEFLADNNLKMDIQNTTFIIRK